MNLTLAIAKVSADLARRVPDMARDSAVNNEALINRLLTESLQADAPRDLEYYLHAERRLLEHLEGVSLPTPTVPAVPMPQLLPGEHNVFPKGRWA